MQPSVYITMPVYNGKKNLEYSLPSLRKTPYKNYKLIIADNASTDGSAAFAKKAFPGAIILTQKINRFYGGGCNAGIRYALSRNADYVLLLNDDVKVDPRWLTYAVKAAESDPKIGLIEFQISNPTGRGDLKKFEEDMKNFKSLEITEVKNVTGCSMFVRASLFKQLGLMDEGYVIYNEETDFVKRVQKAGLKSVKINVPLYHYGEASSSKIRVKASVYSIRNIIRLSIKHATILEAIKNIGFLLKVSLTPFRKPKDLFEKRLRPFNAFVNLFILAGAFFWNLAELPQTLMIRRKENKRIRQFRLVH